MMSRMERELAALDQKSLYKKDNRHRFSLVHNYAEHFLPVSTANNSRNNLNASTSSINSSSHPGRSGSHKNSISSMNQNSITRTTPMLPKLPVLTQLNHYSTVPAPPPPPPIALTSISNNFNNDNGKNKDTVIVELSNEKSAPISKVIQNVTELKNLRERHEIYGSEESLEANIEATMEEQELKKFHQVQRSKQLMIKYNVYDFLRRPGTVWSTIYHIFAFMLVAACLIVSVFPEIENSFGSLPVLDSLEKIVLLWFSAEYILKLWACESRPQYQGWRGKIKFIKAPSHLIDLFIIVLSAVVSPLAQHDSHEVFAFRTFRGFHRFFQVLQVITLKRQLRPWRLFMSVLYDQREQLLIIFYLEIVLLCSLSYLCFLVEHETNPQLNNIADAMWWGVVTLTTLGYGDRFPITVMGKIISAIFIMFGVAVFALPAGIIGAGLALKLEEVERNRQRRKKKDAAALLIQRSWKCYKANKRFEELSKFFRHRPADMFKDRVYEKISNAFYATVQFHLAKSSFRELRRPIDLKNVIESYKYGQIDIFTKLKQLNSALDIIISRMSIAENERLTSINRLTKKLESMESSHSSCSGGATSSGGKAQCSCGGCVCTVRTKSATYVTSLAESNENVTTSPTIPKIDFVHIPNSNARSIHYRSMRPPGYSLHAPRTPTNFNYPGGIYRRSEPIPTITEVNLTDSQTFDSEIDGSARKVFNFSGSPTTSYATCNTSQLGGPGGLYSPRIASPTVTGRMSYAGNETKDTHQRHRRHSE